MYDANFRWTPQGLHIIRLIVTSSIFGHRVTMHAHLSSLLLLLLLFLRPGDGLGKNLQGMQTPLVAQKTDRRAGVIVNAEPTATARFSSASASASSRASPSAELPDAKRPKAGAALVGKPSRVICLRNMVSVDAWKAV